MVKKHFIFVINKMFYRYINNDTPGCVIIEGDKKDSQRSV